ncbi:RING/U-box superfamily protein [Actinidia rufa]|uniref:RING/U-box superfamily protein n=1 Tax=Actinidia rufa TaxID=165716 RepID=A0A7J0GJQ2_9ERIC|nr:RING/U-box superfamily protein [Actinidia rufa]
MSSPPTLLRPPPPPSHYWLSDSSPILPVVSILAFAGLIVLIYAFFFSIKCPPNPFHRRSPAAVPLDGPGRLAVSSKHVEQMVSSVEYAAQVHGGGSECPVCLTAFVDGEVIRKVIACGHLFHTTCIEMWLTSHSNCPVCRACIGAAKRSKTTAATGGEDDFQQGLPDSARLV